MSEQMLANLRAAWTALAPHLARLLAVLGGGLAYCTGIILRHRLALFRVSHRIMWWTALAVMFLAGRALLGGLAEGPIIDDSHLYFAAGLGLCVVVLAFAAERRLRLAAFFLGSGHGAFALLTWLVSQP